MTKIDFVKTEASGNDFIIIDRVKSHSSLSKLKLSTLAKKLCQRKKSVGGDGLLVIEPSKKADFKMRIINPDGSEVNMCGNGSRCVVLYALRERKTAKRMIIETGAGNLHAQLRQNKVKIKMTEPKDLRLKFSLNINSKAQNVSYINTGVPHLVCFVQNLVNFPVAEMGKAIRYHSEFQPEGTNADFVEVLGKGHIRLRTYERGVERETFSCGTGVVAAGIITALQMEKPDGKHKIKVDTQGGERLRVYFKLQKKKIKDVFLEGPANIVYKGSISLQGG